MPLRTSIADLPVRTSRLPAFRAEYFPDSGPYPWLDRDDAEQQIPARLERQEISSAEADMCRYWAANGYIVLENLFDASTLDEVWEGYEKAIRAGRIKLPPEPAGERDPWPGRHLNPHKRVGAF
ncbi:MAG: phytanoyl-CoA dioxygenase, partial [Acidobacteriota bacterium]|nr:phytanoyl-CoA dioxygenase [Acidobacteriota bacterium]